MISLNNDPTSAGDEPAGRREAAGTRLRAVVLGMGLGLAICVVAVVGYLLATAERKTPLTQEAYDAAVERWDQKGPADYDLDIELAGNRPGTIHVEVRQGQVTHMKRDGVEPRQERTWYYWSVPGQLDTIGQELEMARDPADAFRNPAASQMLMWAEFDAKLGYPKKYDRVVLGVDYEVHWRVRNFRAITAKN
jgi:hypothetical protein